jgi:hypothetical protein
MEEEEMAVARQWLGKHFSTAMNQHGNRGIVGSMFSKWSILRLHNEDQWEKCYDYL